MKRLLLACMITFLIAPACAAAGQLPEEAVESLSKRVHERLAGARISNGHIITQEEAKTLSYPLLPFDLREKIIIRGTVSGFAQWCGLDWERRSFMPLMAWLRKDKMHNDYQLAYAGMLHGTSMQSAINSQAGKICDDTFKGKIEKNIAK